MGAPHHLSHPRLSPWLKPSPKVTQMRNRQRQYVEATVDEEVVHASVLAPPTIPDTHLDGILVYHSNPSHLALCQLEI